MSICNYVEWVIVLDLPLGLRQLLRKEEASFRVKSIWTVLVLGCLADHDSDDASISVKNLIFVCLLANAFWNFHGLWFFSCNNVAI